MADGFIRLDAALPELAGCTLFSLSLENEERIKRSKSPVLFFRANVLDDAEWMAIPYDVSWVHDVANDREWITYKAVCNGGQHDGRIVFELSISDYYIMQEYHADGTVPDAWMAFCNAFLPVYGVESGMVCTRLPDSDIEGNRGSMDFLMPKDVEKHLFLPMDYFESLRGEVRPVADEKPVDAPTVASGAPTGDGTAAASKPVADATFGGSLDDIQAKELRLAIAAYFHAEKRVADGGGYPFKRYIEEYLKGAGLSSDAAIKRIATVANKDKKTGRK